MRISLELSDFFFNHPLTIEANTETELENAAEVVLAGWQENYGDLHLDAEDLVSDYKLRL